MSPALLDLLLQLQVEAFVDESWGKGPQEAAEPDAIEGQAAAKR